MWRLLTLFPLYSFISKSWLMLISFVFFSMILLRIQMFSFTELAELLGWVDKEVLSFSFCQRLISYVSIHVIITTRFIISCSWFKHSIHVLWEVISLVMRMQEEAYVEFLHIRRVPLQKKEKSDHAPDVVPQVRVISVVTWSVGIDIDWSWLSW